MRAAAQTIVNLPLKRGINGWRSNYEAKRRAKQLLTVAIQGMLHAKARMAFNAWIEQRAAVLAFKAKVQAVLVSLTPEGRAMKAAFRSILDVKRQLAIREALMVIVDGVGELSLSVSPAWTVSQLRETIEQAVHKRMHVAAAVSLSLKNGRSISSFSERTLQELGLVGEKSCVRCSLVVVPRIRRCMPSYGPVSGGNLLTVHGSGFLAESVTGGRLSFGQGYTVPCKRRSDNELQCRVPRHLEGSVAVTLLGCAGAAHAGSTSYEYVKEGRMRDQLHRTGRAAIDRDGVDALS